MKVAEVKKILIHKGVKELFHVNSVITSLTLSIMADYYPEKRLKNIISLKQISKVTTLIKNSIYTMTYSLIRLTYMSVQRM